jgi:flagellar motor component MotA
MNRTEFVESFVLFLQKALDCSNKARREGLLALDEGLDPEKVDERDIFEYGLRFVVDGTDAEIIEKVLSNIVAQEKDEDLRLLKTIQEEAVLGIQSGLNPRMLFWVLNSYTDIPLNDGKMKDIENALWSP